jgi:hypothetical protein
MYKYTPYHAIFAVQIAIHCPKNVCFWTNPHYSPQRIEMFTGFPEIQQHHYIYICVCVCFLSFSLLFAFISSVFLVQNHSVWWNMI